MKLAKDKKMFDIINSIINRQRYFFNKNTVILVGKNLSKGHLENIKKRFDFYCPGAQLKKSTVFRALLNFNPILLFGKKFLISEKMDRRFRFITYNIDCRTNPVEEWEWNHLAEQCALKKTNINDSKDCFVRIIKILKEMKLEKCYLFGTGPSLEKAIEMDWSDGYRIVCNTIVRDQSLWNHINPHIIVAGDAIYHFGPDSFARTFRDDLNKRLSETSTFFIYPDFFNSIVQREFPKLSDRLIPIPIGVHQNIHQDLTKNFSLPQLGNVLPLLLLPVGCSLSKNINLWGFDERGLTDSLSWEN